MSSGVRSPPAVTRTNPRVLRSGAAGIIATPSTAAAAGSGAARLAASPAAAISAVPVVSKTAEQLDRAKLDARLSALLGNPTAFTAGGGGGPTAPFVELDELREEAAHQQRLTDLRGLEAALELDDWSYS
jgi:hypothetical protein